MVAMSSIQSIYEINVWNHFKPDFMYIQLLSKPNMICVVNNRVFVDRFLFAFYAKVQKFNCLTDALAQDEDLVVKTLDRNLLTNSPFRDRLGVVYDPIFYI